MSLEVIKLRSFAEPDRSEVQRRVAQEVEQDPEKFLARYAADPRSHNGRYVNSDLMKETCDEYRQSRESRSRYNTAVHNSAAVLASEQFRRVIADDSDSSRDTATFLTGIPGAGKTSHVLRGGEVSPFIRVLYEGQLAKPEQALEKISIAVDLGLQAKILWFTSNPSERCKIRLTDLEKTDAARVLRRWRVFRVTCLRALRSSKSILATSLIFG